MPLAQQSERYPANRADVDRHVLALRAVATRRPCDQHAVAIRQRDRRPIDLELDRVAALVHRRPHHALDGLLEGE